VRKSNKVTKEVGVELSRAKEDIIAERKNKALVETKEDMRVASNREDMAVDKTIMADNRGSPVEETFPRVAGELPSLPWHIFKSLWQSEVMVVEEGTGEMMTWAEPHSMLSNMQEAPAIQDCFRMP
jgi:hypothetical protein